MPAPGPGGSQTSLASMVSWLTSRFRTTAQPKKGAPIASYSMGTDASGLSGNTRGGDVTQFAPVFQPTAGMFSPSFPPRASSDATNIDTRISRDADDYVINGRAPRRSIGLTKSILKPAAALVSSGSEGLKGGSPSPGLASYIPPPLPSPSPCSGTFPRFSPVDEAGMGPEPGRLPPWAHPRGPIRRRAQRAVCAS
jgi:hypothetical protein